MAPMVVPTSFLLLFGLISMSRSLISVEVPPPLPAVSTQEYATGPPAAYPALILSMLFLTLMLLVTKFGLELGGCPSLISE